MDWWRLLFALTFVLGSARGKQEIWNSAPMKLLVGSDYLYNYDAQLVSGLSSSSSQYTGYRLLSELTLQVKKSNEVTMYLSQIRFLQLHGNVPGSVPTVFLPVEVFQELSDDSLKVTMMKDLERPIRFRWQGGAVRYVQVDQEDPAWSVNMKKGILNLLNMQLKIQEEGTAYRHSEYEEGVEGLCRSLYHWNRLPALTEWEHDQAERNQSLDSVSMEVTRLRNLQDCMDSPILDETTVLEQGCRDNVLNVSRKTIQGEVRIHGVVSFWKTTKEVFLWKVQADSQYSFTPIDDVDSEPLTTSVKQDLVFVKVMDTLGASLFDGSRPTASNYRREPTLKLTMLPTIDDFTQSEGKALRETVLHYLSQVDDEVQKERKSTEKQLRLLSQWLPQLRQAPKDLLLEIKEKSSTNPKLTELFNRILPLVGTSEALEVILNQNLKNLDDALMASQLKEFASSRQVLQPRVIGLLVRTAQNPVLRRSKTKATLKTLLELVGQVAGNILSYTKTQPMKDSKPKLLYTEVLTFYRNLENQKIWSLTEEEKLMAICKGMGHVAVQESLTFLNNVIYERNVSVGVKVVATEAFHRLAYSFPDAVRRILMPNLLDANQHLPLRIASYKVVMASQPSFTELTAIVEAVQKDPDSQLTSFIRSHMYAISEGVTSDCEARLVPNVTRVLQNFNIRLGADWHQSRVIALPLLKVNPGCSKSSGRFLLRSDLIWPSNGALLPQMVDLRLILDSSGRKSDFLGVKVRVEAPEVSKEAGQQQSIMENYLARTNISAYLTSPQGVKKLFYVRGDQLQNLQKWMFIASGMEKREPFPVNWSHMLYENRLMKLPTTFGFTFFAKQGFIGLAEVRAKLQLVQQSGGDKGFYGSLNMEPEFIAENQLEAGVDGIITKSMIRKKMQMSFFNNTRINMNMRYESSSRDGLQIHIEQPQDTWNLVYINKSWETAMAANGKKMTSYSSDDNMTSRQVRLPLRPFPTSLYIYVSQFQEDDRLSPQQEECSVQPSSAVITLENVGQSSPGDGLLIRFPRLTAESTGRSLLHYIVLFSKSKWDSKQLMRSFYAPLKEESRTETSRAGVQAREILGSIRFTLNQRDLVDGTAFDFLIRFYSSVPSLMYSLDTTMKVMRTASFNASNPLSVTADSYSGNCPVTLTSSLTQTDADLKLFELKFTADLDPRNADLMKKVVQKPNRFPNVKPELAICSNDLSNEYYGTPACREAWKYLNSYNRYKLNVYMNDVTRSFSLTVKPFNQHEATLNEFSPYIQAIKSLYGAFPLLPPITSLPTDLKSMVLNAITDNLYLPTCRVNWQGSNKTVFIQTFDRLFYHTPGEVLEKPRNVDYLYRVVVAQDLQGQFQIAYFLSQLGFGVDVLTPLGASVQRVSATFSDSVGVFLNGEMPINSLPYTKLNEKGKMILHIDWITKESSDLANEASQQLRISMPLLGIEIVTDFRNDVALRVSPIYASQLRGLCGDFDGNIYQELKDPSCEGFLVDPSLASNNKFGYTRRYPPQSMMDVNRLEERFFLPLKPCSPRGPTPATGGPLKPITNFD